MKKLKNTNKGITLIALVITIIVMLILVAVTISMAVNGGLFEYASNAGAQTNAAVDAEQQLASGRIKIGDYWYDSQQDYVDGKPSANQGDGEGPRGGSGNELPVYASAKFANGVLAENATFSSDGYTAVIPKGFKIINGLEGTQSIASGLVIQDATGNEFVWIPVEYTASGTKDENGLDTGFTDTFKRSNVDDEDYLEPYSSGYSEGNGTQEKADYYDMMKSVQDNYGFYMGRYEAGTTTPRTLYEKDDATITDAQRTAKVVVKRDVYPYTFVGWGNSMDDYTKDLLYKKSYYVDEDDDGCTDSEVVVSYNQGKGALYLSKHLLDGQTTGAKSTLCYGVQWDAMIRFMGKDKEPYSAKWGNYIDNNLKIKRTSAKYYSNDQWIQVTETGIPCGRLLTTGADDSFASKNIFDVTGNYEEWTMEANSSYSCRCVRGGDCYRLFHTRRP